MPFHTQVISTNDHEALYLIDGLCNHETDLHITESEQNQGRLGGQFLRGGRLGGSDEGVVPAVKSTTELVVQHFCAHLE